MIVAQLREDLKANTGRSRLLFLPLALVSSPGFLVIFLYRISSVLERRNALLRALGMLVWRMGVMVSGSYIHPRARIGAGLALPHPTGIVIGAGARLGRNVTLYQNVTLGAKSPAEFDYPELEDGVSVFAGACILGRIRIGQNALVGANAVVLASVPPDAVAVGVPAKVKMPAGPVSAAPESVI